MKTKATEIMLIESQDTKISNKSSESVARERYRLKQIKFVEHGLTHIPSIVPINLHQEKDKFLREGKIPKFIVKANTEELEALAMKAKGKIRFGLLAEAEYILEMVRKKYGEGENFLQAQFGPRITQEDATEKLAQYLDDNSLNESLTIVWCHDLPCSARMMWQGPYVKSNRPEARRYSLWLNSSLENPYIRENGITSLLDHEIGTHFCRMYNDGLQPWFSDRKRFGLRGMNSLEGVCTEEGLAAINTVLRSTVPYLWLSALAYYTACKSAEMNFKELFNHLGRYLHNPEQRWKHVVRVKRSLADPNDIGGYGKDQCYFEGAVQILRDINNIDFHLLMAGKVCLDELSRVKRVARQNCLKIPMFMKNQEKYKQKLHRIAILNGLYLEHSPRLPPSGYLLRLEERQNKVCPAEGAFQPRHKVRKRRRQFSSVCSTSKSENDISLCEDDSICNEREINQEGSEDQTPVGGFSVIPTFPSSCDALRLQSEFDWSSSNSKISSLSDLFVDEVEFESLSEINFSSPQPTRRDFPRQESKPKVQLSLPPKVSSNTISSHIASVSLPAVVKTPPPSNLAQSAECLESFICPKDPTSDQGQPDFWDIPEPPRPRSELSLQNRTDEFLGSVKRIQAFGETTSLRHNQPRVPWRGMHVLKTREIEQQP